MHSHSHNRRRRCACGALGETGRHRTVCAKCRARAQWLRRKCRPDRPGDDS